MKPLLAFADLSPASVAASQMLYVVACETEASMSAAAAGLGYPDTPPGHGGLIKGE